MLRNLTLPIWVENQFRKFALAIGEIFSRHPELSQGVHSWKNEIPCLALFTMRYPEPYWFRAL